MSRQHAPPSGVARPLSPLASGLTVTQTDKRSARSLPRNAHLTAAPHEHQPKSHGSALLRVQATGEAPMSNDAKRLTTRILPSDDRDMVERKKKAQKRIDRKRKQRKRLLQQRHRDERPEPKEPPAIDYAKFTEEEIAIMSGVLEREVAFSRDLFGVEQGLHQEAGRIRRRSSPDPQDYSEVCMVCDRVRHCGLVRPLFGRKCLWVCEADQYERLRQLYSGGWYHQHDGGYDLDLTSRLLQTFSKIRHIGLSEDLEFMAQHETSVGNIQLRLLYTEDLNCLMVSILQTGDLDIKLSSYHPNSQMYVEVFLIPHWSCERFSTAEPMPISESPTFNRIFMWMHLTTQQLEQSKLQITLWVKPTYSEDEGYPPPPRSRRYPFHLVGLTEIPLTTVPLNDIPFLLSLFPGAGKDVYLPVVGRRSQSPNDNGGVDGDEEDDTDGQKSAMVGKDTQPRRESTAIQLASAGTDAKQKLRTMFGGRKEEKKETAPKKKRRSTMREVQTEVLKGGKVTARAGALKWTLDVYKQVLRRENEERIKSEQKKAEAKMKSKAAEEQEDVLAERATILLEHRKGTGQGGSATNTLNRSGAIASGLLKSLGPLTRSRPSTPAPPPKVSFANLGDGVDEPDCAGMDDSQNPKLLDLADEWTRGIPSGQEESFKSPLVNGKDYRLDSSHDAVEDREQMVKFVRGQYDNLSMVKLPSKTAQALRVQVERDRLVTLPELHDESVNDAAFADLFPEEDHSSDEETNFADEEIVVVGTTDLMNLGPGQVRKRKHLGAVPNGKMLLSFQLQDESLTLQIVRLVDMWNYSSGELTVRSCLLVNKQSFMSQSSEPTPGGEIVEMKWTQTYQKQALNRILQLTVKQKGPKHFLRRASNVTIAQVLINLAELELQDGKEMIEWYPMIGLRRGKIFNRKGNDASNALGRKAKPDFYPTLARAGALALVAFNTPGRDLSHGSGDDQDDATAAEGGQGVEHGGVFSDDTRDEDQHESQSGGLPPTVLQAALANHRSVAGKKHSRLAMFGGKPDKAKKHKKHKKHKKEGDEASPQPLSPPSQQPSPPKTPSPETEQETSRR